MVLASLVYAGTPKHTSRASVVWALEGIGAEWKKRGIENYAEPPM